MTAAEHPPDDAPQPAASSRENRDDPSRFGKSIPGIAITIWLIYHILGAIIFPASVKSYPGSLLFETSRFWEPYMEGLHMIHGHRFFAPDPPTTGMLIEYEIAEPDGRVTIRQFPNRAISPRLMYHRYFMLSERAQFAVTNDIENDPQIPEEERNRAKAVREAWFRMYARHLLRWHGGERIVLRRVYHEVVSPRYILDGGSLDDPKLYRRVELGAWTRQELGLPE